MTLSLIRSYLFERSVFFKECFELFSVFLSAMCVISEQVKKPKTLGGNKVLKNWICKKFQRAEKSENSFFWFHTFFSNKV